MKSSQSRWPLRRATDRKRIGSDLLKTQLCWVVSSLLLVRERNIFQRDFRQGKGQEEKVFSFSISEMDRWKRQKGLKAASV